MVRKEAGIKHLSDILGSDKRVLRFGATEAGSSNFVWAVFLKDIGAQIRVVTGHAGAAPIYLEQKPLNLSKSSQVVWRGSTGGYGDGHRKNLRHRFGWYPA
jgi:hypothetical protein